MGPEVSVVVFVPRGSSLPPLPVCLPPPVYIISSLYEVPHVQFWIAVVDRGVVVLGDDRWAVAVGGGRDTDGHASVDGVVGPTFNTR